MPHCLTFGNISDLLAGRIEDGELAQAWERHLEVCAACRERAVLVHEARDLLDSMPAAPPVTTPAGVCPDQEVLQLFVSGEAGGGSDLTWLMNHLAGCPRCQSVLAGILDGCAAADPETAAEAPLTLAQSTAVVEELLSRTRFEGRAPALPRRRWPWKLAGIACGILITIAIALPAGRRVRDTTSRLAALEGIETRVAAAGVGLAGPLRLAGAGSGSGALAGDPAPAAGLAYAEQSLAELARVPELRARALAALGRAALADPPRLALAYHHLRQAVDSGCSDPAVLNDLAVVIHAVAADRAAAMEVLGEALEIESHYPPAVFNLAYLTLAPEAEPSADELRRARRLIERYEQSGQDLDGLAELRHRYLLKR